MTNTINVGIAGLGAIGMPVARWLDAGVAGLNLCGVSSGNKERAVERVSGFTSPPPVLELQELVSMSDVVVEALPPKHFDEVADLTLAAGKKLIVLTLTSLLPRLDLVDKASNTGGQIIAATGALVGFDAVRAAAKGEIYSVTMKTRKPPEGLKKATFVVEQGIDLDDLKEAACALIGIEAEAAQPVDGFLSVDRNLSHRNTGAERDSLSQSPWAWAREVQALERARS